MTNNNLFHFFTGKSQMRERTLDVEPFQEIRLALLISSLEVQAGDKFQVIVREHEERPVSVNVADGQLSLTETKGPIGTHVSWNTGNKILVFVPKDCELTEIIGNNQNGSIKLINLYCQNVNLEEKNGSVNCTYLKADKLALAIKNGSTTIARSEITSAGIMASNGSIATKGGTLSLTAKDKNGSISVSDTKFIGQNLLEARNGSIKINQLDQDTNYEVITNNGSIRYRGEHVGKSFNKSGTGENSLKVSTLNGSIKLM